MQQDAELADQPQPRSYDFLGLRLSDVDGQMLVHRMSQAVRRRQRLMVINANAHMVVLAQREPWLKGMFNDTNLAFCDGAGVQYATKFLHGFLPRRTTPPQWIDSFASALPAGASIFWVGGSADAVEGAAKTFGERYGLHNAGTQHGYFDHRAGSAANEALIERINALSPDVVMVNMGMPLQERWLYDVWHRLDARVAITGGAMVDHLAGAVRRPPQFVSDMGLEWLVRLVREPRRLWRRYLLGLPAFGLLVLKARLKTFGRTNPAPPPVDTKVRGQEPGRPAKVELAPKVKLAR